MTTATGGTARWTTLLAGLAVALGAAVATAHGLYEVAVAAGAPQAIACLYPLITDGLALVAYASTARLSGGSRRYAWTVVVLAAGLSGLAQATYLAGGVPSAPPALRFGVGAWPAVAAAITAHLLFLLATSDRTPPDVRSTPGVQRSGLEQTAVQPGHALNGSRSHPLYPSPIALDREAEGESANGAVVRPLYGAPARDRARTEASAHLAVYGEWPTVSALMAMAQVSRGTAAKALKHLRTEHGDNPNDVDPIDPRTSS